MTVATPSTYENEFRRCSKRNFHETSDE